MEPKITFIGENLDRLVSLEMRPQGRDQGGIRRLYDAARAKHGEPITTLAARLLAEKVRAGDVVFITTGAGIPDHLPFGETDGPLGAAALALGVSLGLGAVPILVTEAAYLRVQEATCLAIGLGIRTPEVAKKVARTCAVLPFPADDSAPAVAEELMARYAPAALISTEKLGPNEKGVTHSSTGCPAAADRARVEHLFDIAAGKGILTIGIGDNGNEIGCGAIREAVWEHKEWGRVCQCPCGGGLATRVATDVILMAGTSNWGAYGIEAALAAVLGRPEIIHSEADERRMLEACVRLGGADGSTGTHVLAVDGTPADVQVGMINMMRTIVTNGLKPPRKRAF